jgi:hypothetical protein
MYLPVNVNSNPAVVMHQFGRYDCTLAELGTIVFTTEQTSASVEPCSNPVLSFFFF